MSPLVPAHVPAASTPATSGVEAAVRVVCAFPISGQYGPGSRALYYVVVALCILGRRNEQLRSAALAVALVFPAVAALHAIVLCSVHVTGVVDMDVYGAFQLCSIGILAAPTTVRLSDTYKHTRGRKILFLWTGLMVAGLVCLIVEFYRATAIPCSRDDHGNPIQPSKFPYQNAQCGLRCSEEDGPFSPMRGGAAGNVYVIPEPDKLTFNTALIIAAACCIPAILSIAFTSLQDLENNWKKRFGLAEQEEKNMDEPIPGTNGATPKQMETVQNKIREYQYYIEVPLFGAAVLAILVLGELNFFSHQVNYETEPIASIGQWGTLAGTALAAFGTLYMIMASEIQKQDELINGADDACGEPRHSQASNDFGPLTSRRTNETGIHRVSVGKVGTALNTISDRMSVVAHKKLDDSDFKTGEARGFPTIPGEEFRSPNLPQIREAYDPKRDERGDITPELRASRSRAGSFMSVATGLGIDGVESGPSTSLPPSNPRRDTLDRSPSPTSPGTVSRTRSRSPASPMTVSRRNTVDDCPSPISPISSQRRNTLEVPQHVYHKP